jgi:hypothetical protein
MRPFANLIMAAVVSLAFSGCLVDMLASTAIESGLQAQQMSTLKNTLDHVKDTTSDLGVNQAIQAFQAEHGRSPASLQELVPEYMPQVPVRPDGKPYGYDPATGQLLEGPGPVPAVIQPRGESNAQKMQRIREAINKFGTATGYYPGSLAQLVPMYLPEAPKTADGRDFIYVKENGGLFAPEPLTPASPAPYGGQAAPSRPMVGGGGIGPMGEAMTGIGISNQLDNMSSAGSSAVSSRVRGDAHNAGQQHDQQQQQVMNDLGL